MSEIDYALFEAPVGYALFKVVKQSDVVSLKTKEGQETANDLAKFGKMIKLQSFSPFRCDLLAPLAKVAHRSSYH